jgi:hypothetical protein
MTDKEKILDYITKNSDNALGLVDIWSGTQIELTEIDAILQELETEGKIDIIQSAGREYFKIR